MKEKCHYCKINDAEVPHHISYEPEETVSVCKKCHYKITTQIKLHKKQHTRLCIKCGRHFTGNDDRVCWHCKNPDKKDWFGLTSNDVTKPLFYYNDDSLDDEWI